MPRTDTHGKQLHALLAYLLDGEAETRDIYRALEISSSTYYRRMREPDYPNAEELRKVAMRLGLSFADLQVRFGLLNPEELTIYAEYVSESRHPRCPPCHNSHSATTPRQIEWS